MGSLLSISSLFSSTQRITSLKGGNPSVTPMPSAIRLRRAKSSGVSTPRIKSGRSRSWGGIQVAV